jgi:photosystem II stability/assembly factor-like uncharacterized protein
MKRFALLVLALVILTGASYSADTSVVSILKSGKFGGDVRGIDFINATTGFAVGDGTNTVAPTNSFIAKTTDGGNTWVNISPAVLTNRPWQVDFINATTGLVCGYGGMILRTTNAGTNWTVSTTPNTSNIYEVVMVSTDTGYACGALSAAILKTVDGGVTWSSVAVTGTNTRYGIAFAPGGLVWISGTSGNVIRSTDNGGTWSTTTITGSPTCYDIIRVGSDLWAFSSSNGVFRSTDAGASFTLVFDNGSRAIYGASVFGTTNFIAVGTDGLNYRSTNAGTSFDSTALTLFTGQTSRGVYMKSATDIIVGGDMGNIFRSTNGGTSYYNVESANRMYAVDFLNANTGVAVGFSGMVFRTTNAGANWVNLPSGSSLEMYDVQMFDANTFYIAAATGRFFVTTNGGANFIERPLPNITSGATKTIWFHNQNTGFAAGEMGNIYSTTDAGVTWTSVYSWGTSFNNFEDIYFVNTSTGYATGERGRFIKTSDGGATWDSTGIDGPNLNIMWEMDWLNATTGFMASTSGCIFKSTNAGANWVLLNDTAGMSGVDVIDIEVVDTGRGFAVAEQGYVFKQKTQSQWVTERQLVTSFGSEENLWGIDFAGNSTAYVSGYYGTIYRLDITSTVGVTGNTTPLVYSLNQNYPNPFNPSTVINFTIPEAQVVKLRVFDVLGREVAQLVNTKMNAGSYDIEWNAKNITSGVYFYKLEAGNYTDVKKMILVK